MRLSFDSWELELRSHASEAEMRGILKQCESFEVLDASEGHAHLFYSLKFRPQFVGQQSRPMSIGLCSSQTGIEPQLLPSAPDGLLYVGLASSVFVFRVATGQTKRLDLASPFYWMTRLTSLGKILVVHETGLLCLHTDGEAAWQYCTGDIISSVKLSSPHIVEVMLLEGGSNAVDLTNGTVLDASSP